jgi:hypothetical protein
VKPSDALKQGRCPFCVGRRRVTVLVPEEHEAMCPLCAGTGEWPPPVVMLDLTDLTLHKPSHVHLITACGVPMAECTVGAADMVQQRAQRICPECWGIPDDWIYEL